MLNLDLGIVTPIWKTDYSLLKEMVESVNRLFKSGITFQWSIVIDGDFRDIEDFLREIIDPLLLQNCFMTTLDKQYGPSFARNCGVKALDSKLICWLDADDAIDTKNFVVVFKELSSKQDSFWDNYDLVYTDSYDCDLYLNITSIRRKKVINDLHCKYKNTELDPLLGVDFVYQMQFIKKETFLSVGGFDEHLIYGEDVDLILRISEKSRNVNLFHMPIPVYCYRDNPYGRSNTRWRELKYQMERIYLKCSKRQNLPFYEYRFMGTFCINENIFENLKGNDNFNHKSLYDIYLPINNSNQIIHRPYIKM